MENKQPEIDERTFYGMYHLVINNSNIKQHICAANNIHIQVQNLSDVLICAVLLQKFQPSNLIPECFFKKSKLSTSLFIITG